MKRIILMRHSLAEHGYAGITDEERSLTSQGIQLIHAQAIKLQQINVFPGLFISSHTVRAFTTAKLLARQLNYMDPIMVEPFLYHDFTTQEFINLIHKTPNSFDTVLIVGHNPTISTQLQRLTGTNNYSFPPAAIAIINLHSDVWNSIVAGNCKLEQYLLP